jgi:hypothetical protein
MKLSDVTIVSTAGDAVILGTDNINSAVAVKALATNTATVYVGNDGANDVSELTGFPLDAGETLVFDYVGDLADVYVDADVSNEGVSWIKLN